jgi:ribosome biogenesis protein Nip4
VEHVARTGQINKYKILVEKPEGKSPLEKPRRRGEDNIRRCLRQIGCEVVDWRHLAQDRGQL